MAAKFTGTITQAYCVKPGRRNPPGQYLLPVGNYQEQVGGISDEYCSHDKGQSRRLTEPQYEQHRNHNRRQYQCSTVISKQSSNSSAKQYYIIGKQQATMPVDCLAAHSTKISLTNGTLPLPVNRISGHFVLLTVQHQRSFEFLRRC